MAVRVSDDEVKEIIDTSLTDLTAFILVASQQVDRISGLGTAVLKEIERWLAAYFVSMRDKRTAKDNVGDSSHTYEGKTGTGLSFNRYGQAALLLDTTGTLAKLGLKKAALTYLGGTVNAQGEVEV